MKRFDFEDCIREGLLGRVPPSNERADASIKTAKKWLSEAEKGIGSGTFNSSVISSYLSMFHSSRAILFLDGFREKSHFCIARYLEEKYVKKSLLESKWIKLLDYYREMRHNNQYNTEFFSSKEDAENIFKNAKEFVNRMEALLKAKMR
ncbi:MAG: HEPN domain-containing protein [Candidatus Aenigmarchaeota archaeon]|nr:HEPN domain-containing protein [Candidatus Aenigmarchaeota archaeon]